MKTTTQKYLSIIKSGKIEEKELISLFSFLNNGRGGTTKEDFNIISSALWETPLKLSKEQNEKGFKFLMNQWKTPTGKERLNNPFGYREETILTNFSHFELKGYYDAGNYNRAYYVPLYDCIGDNTSFEYYYNGKVNIVG